MRRFLVILTVLVAFPASADFSFLGLKNSLVDFALEQISVPGELELKATGVEDSEDGATEIVGLTVADGQGVWLSIERLSLNWNPSRILRGELEIGRLAAIGVDVKRPPAASAVAVEVNEDAAIAQTDDDPFDWPRAPIAVRIDELALERVTIAPGVAAPVGVAFDAQGAARDEGDEQAVRLTVTRIDDVEGRIALDYLRDFAAESLDLKLDAVEAAGGVVAALADFPATSASVVKVDASGPLADWRVTLEARADDVFDATGQATVAALDRLAVNGDFVVTPGPALSDAVRTALSPRATIAVDVAEDDAGVIRIREGALTARDLSLTADGSYDQAEALVDLVVDLEARAGLADLVEGVDFESFGFDGMVRGALDDLVAEGLISLRALTTAPADVGGATLAARVAVKGDVIDATLDGDASDLRLDRLGPDLLGETALRVVGVYDGAAARLETLSLAAAPLSLTASGTVDLGANAAALTYALDAPALGPLAAAYDVNAAGALSASGDLSGPLDAARLVGRLALEQLRFENEGYGSIRLEHDAVFDETPSGAAALRAEGSRFGPLAFDGDFELRETLLSLKNLTASGLDVAVDGAVDVDLEKTLLSGEVALDAPDFSRLGEALGQPLAGGASGRVALAGEDAQAVGLTLSLKDFDGFGARLAAADLTADVADALGAPSVVADLKATGASGFGVTAGAFAATAQASALTGGDPRFDVDFALDRLGAGGANVARMTGAVVGALSDLKADLKAARIAAPGATVADVSLTAAVRDAASRDPRLDARLVASNAEAGGASIETASLTARGALSALDASLTAAGAGPGGEPLSLETSARANLAGETITASIAALSARFADVEAALRAPLSLAARNGTTRLTGLDLALPGGGLTGDAVVYPNGLGGDLALAMDDLTPLAVLADAPLESGALEVEARFDTRRGAARADIDAAARGLRFKDVVADVGALDLEAAIDWDGAAATLAAALSGPFGEPMRARLAAPLRPSGGPLPTPPRSGVLDGAFDWSGDIGELWALVPAPGHVLDGATRVALRLGGTVAAPEIGGDVAITDGRYENLDVGTILVDLDVASTVSSAGAFTVDLSANDGAGDPVTARIALADGEVDASIQADGATLVRRDDATAAISLDISAKGPLAGPAIKGRIGIDRAEIRLVDATPPGVADLGPVRIKGEPIPEEADGAGGAISLDLKIEGPRDIFVRGRGLDSEWMIDLAITGTAAKPSIEGAIEKRRGVLSFLGAPLDLANGEIRFFGKAEPDPRIDILLERENDGITGGIAVTGTASEPQINFVSRPSLPEDEVLPRILFGRSQQSLSPSEALSLAIGLSTLLDGSGGSIDGVRSAVGVDVLRIEDDGETGPSVTVGSNIVDGVFVGAKQPIGGGSASVQVEVEVFDDFSIDSETGPDVGTSIGLNWKRDF